MGNPFVHVELNTQDPDRARSFHGQLFDWKLEDVPMGPGGRFSIIADPTGAALGLWKSR